LADAAKPMLRDQRIADSFCLADESIDFYFYFHFYFTLIVSSIDSFHVVPRITDT